MNHSKTDFMENSVYNKLMGGLQTKFDHYVNNTLIEVVNTDSKSLNHEMKESIMQMTIKKYMDDPDNERKLKIIDKAWADSKSSKSKFSNSAQTQPNKTLEHFFSLQENDNLFGKKNLNQTAIGAYLGAEKSDEKSGSRSSSNQPSVGSVGEKDSPLCGGDFFVHFCGRWKTKIISFATSPNYNKILPYSPTLHDSLAPPPRLYQSSK